MGNCLAQQQKLIRIMKTDGKIVEYTSPLQAHQVLSEFAGHAIFQNLKRPDGKEDGGGVRIKLVIRRQDLEMLSKGGVSVEDMILQLQNPKLVDSFQKFAGDCNRNRKGWKPALQSIPEVC